MPRGNALPLAPGAIRCHVYRIKFSMPDMRAQFAGTAASSVLSK
jgi:hypothetical protein